MTVWPVTDFMEFARALREAGDCFVARRVMQRLDDESLTIREATTLLRGVALLTSGSAGTADRAVEQMARRRSSGDEPRTQTELVTLREEAAGQLAGRVNEGRKLL